ncbi:pyridoxamine 5'-phosphate oxidase-domain-containing protein [Xylariomycetidae sp. FL0641]|nr:pyridoxamine 5'-phosphate oxidase-domain-containing protein [Xylariomycetidae sp. FL0641]
MSTSSVPAPAPAPWRSLFLEHIQTMLSPEFVLSTVRYVPSSSSSSSSSPSGGGGSTTTTTTPSPRARTCIFRGLWAELPVNPKNDAPLNPAGADTGSDCLTFTTDARMDKMAELFGVPEPAATDDEDDATTRERLQGSGGGAPVEAVFWAPQPMTQWRVRGAAYVVAPDIEDTTTTSPPSSSAAAAGRDSAKEALRRRMRGVPDEGGEGEEDWSFARELTAHFGNLSPAMRGSFRNPPPGRPTTTASRPLGDEGRRLALGQKVTDLHDDVARANFRVVVIVPHQVDRCDLSDPARGRRWLYTFRGGGGGGGSETPGALVEGDWEKVEVWP